MPTEYTQTEIAAIKRKRECGPRGIGLFQKGPHLGERDAAQGEPHQYDANREASYIAGLSAYRLSHSAAAAGHLQSASRSGLTNVSADAQVTLGRLYAEQNRHSQAASAYLAAAPKLTGQAKANAYYYAAKSQQSLGQWTTARSHLLYAKRLSSHRSSNGKSSTLSCCGW